MARWKLALPAAIIIGLVLGVVTASLGGSSHVRPAEAGEDSYALREFSVSYPLVIPISGEAQEGVAGVTMVAQATTDRFAGDVSCHLDVFSADGTRIGQSDFGLGFNGTDPISVGPIGVPVEGMPMSAQGYCEKGRPPDPGAGYSFSDLRTVQEPHPALVGRISWKNDVMPGEFQCTAVIETLSGQEEVPFSLAQDEGEGIIVLLSEELSEGQPIDVACEPMVGQPTSD